MSQISQALEKGFLKYYNTVIKTGTVSKKSIDNLIVASWINDVLEGKYDCTVSEEQYTLLNNLYVCIEGSCLVPYRSYQAQCTSKVSTIVIYAGSGSNFEDFYTNKVEYSLPTTVPSNNYDIVIRNAEDNVYFLVPSYMSIDTATLGGFNFPLMPPVDTIIDGIEYKYYKSSNTYDSGTITIIIQ